MVISNLSELMSVCFSETLFLTIFGFVLSELLNFLNCLNFFKIRIIDIKYFFMESMKFCRDIFLNLPNWAFPYSLFLSVFLSLLCLLLNPECPSRVRLFLVQVPTHHRTQFLIQSTSISNRVYNWAFSIPKVSISLGYQSRYL